MRVLAIDTALGACSAAVLDIAGAEPLAVEQMPLERGHAEALMPLIERVMAGVDGGFGSLSRVAVTVGPGSFTGLRVGVAAARAIGLAARIPVVGVSTLAAYCASMMGRVASLRRPSMHAMAVSISRRLRRAASFWRRPVNVH
jgi:tRNA threonylcarbamoyl adenosine modification protein YeaZ